MYRETVEWLEIDILQEFIDRYMEMTYNNWHGRIEFSALYERYRFFVGLNGGGEVMVKNEFSRKLSGNIDIETGYDREKKRVTYVLGVRWKNIAELEEEREEEEQGKEQEKEEEEEEEEEGRGRKRKRGGMLTRYLKVKREGYNVLLTRRGIEYIMHIQ